MADSRVKKISNYITTIGSFDLFKGITQSDLSAVLNCAGAKIENYSKNKILATADSDIADAGLILKGNVAMIKEDEHGHQSLITYMKEGELFGEIFSETMESTSTVSFRTMTKCTIMYIPVGRILNICKNACPFHSRLIFNLFKCLSKTNAGLVRKIDAVSRTTIREKIIAYLKEELEYANRVNHTPENHRITVPMNKTEMAQYLCVHRSALLREIAAMRQDGLISVNGQTFTILE